MARAWVEDLWKGSDGLPSARAGTGLRWRVRWWEQRLAPDGSLERKQRAKSFPRKPAAAAFAAKVEHEQRSGTYRSPELAEVAFADVAAEWLAAHLDVKGSTLREYDRHLRMYVLPRFGAVPIGQVTRAHVASWVADLVKGSAPARYLIGRTGQVGPTETMRRPLAPKTVRLVHTVASAVLGWAVATDRIAANPAAGVRLPRVVASDEVYLTHRQVDALAKGAVDIGTPQDGTLMLLLAYTGLRIGEATALTVADVDVARRRVTVRQTWTDDRDGLRVLGSPKTHERRTVPLPSFLALDVAGVIRGREPAAYVFTGPRGGPIHDHNWRPRVFAPAAREAGLDGMGLTPHKLRHTAASAAIAAGADVKVVQQMLGHKDATETLNRYGHLWPDRLDEVAEALARARTAELSTPVASEDRAGMDRATSDGRVYQMCTEVTAESA